MVIPCRSYPILVGLQKLIARYDRRLLLVGTSLEVHESIELVSPPPYDRITPLVYLNDM